MKQSELAELARCSKSTIAKCEGAASVEPAWPLALMIAQALRVPITELLPDWARLPISATQEEIEAAREASLEGEDLTEELLTRIPENPADDDAYEANRKEWKQWSEKLDSPE